MCNQQNNQSQPTPKPESKFNLDGSELVFGYCLTHGYNDVLFLDDNGNEFHFHTHPVIRNDYMACYGEFGVSEPPPPLTDEEWQTIFEQEMTL